MKCFVHRNKKILIMFVITWLVSYIKRPQFGTILWDNTLMSILLKSKTTSRPNYIYIIFIVLWIKDTLILKNDCGSIFSVLCWIHFEK